MLKQSRHIRKYRTHIRLINPNIRRKQETFNDYAMCSECGKEVKSLDWGTKRGEITARKVCLECRKKMKEDWEKVMN